MTLMPFPRVQLLSFSVALVPFKKASNAQNAGASAVVIFNEGQNGRQGLFDGALNEENDIQIPVLSASYATGLALVNAAKT